MMNKLFGALILRFPYVYIFFVVLLLLYSFTQIDLGLTTLKDPTAHSVQIAFQYIGYFQRSLSTIMFLILLISFSIFYLVFFKLAQEKKLEKKVVWKLILITSGILLFSYNAFSYDLFNYVFDAKIITYYHQNPYLHKALDYPGDPMLGFMHWTHRTYPYGPLWLLLTVPLSYLGFHIFWLTFFLFKLLIVGSFLGTVFFIEKIMKKISPEKALLGVVFFAFNPLVLFECLVSAHNDITMMFFGMWSFYYLLSRENVRAFLLLFLSIGIKFATISLLPFYILFLRKKLSFEKSILIVILGLLIAVVIASIRTTFQPWYLLYLLPFASFIAYKRYIIGVTILLCFSALLQYGLFFYTGNWDPPIPLIIELIETVSVFVCLIILFSNFFWNKQRLR